MGLVKKSGQAADPSFLEPRVSQLENRMTGLDDQNRQSTVLQHGLSVINASMDSPVDVEIQGRTLVSLGSSVLDAAKTYVLADKKTKLKWADASTVQGVAKFAGKNEKPAIIRVSNFEGKIAGSSVENPHTAKYRAGSQSTLILPNDVVAAEVVYSQINTLNNVLYSNATANVGGIAQHLFSFDIIQAIERNIGRIPKSTLAEKVQWVKDNVVYLNGIHYGFGSSVGGNKASLAFWRTTGEWYQTVSHTYNSVAKLSRSIGASVPLAIDTNGFAHFLAYADPSDGTTASTINTDYVELEIELKPEAVLHDPIVPLYEVDSTEYAKILVDWNETQVLNRFPRVQGVQHLQNPYIMAEGENLLPPFTEWSLHANARVVNPYELEFNRNAAGQWNTVTFNVLPNQTYTLSVLGGYIELQEDGVYKATRSGVGSLTYTTTASAKTLTIRYGELTNGTFIFSNPMLTLGEKAKPFTPCNPSYLFVQTKLGQIGSVKDTLFKQDGQWIVRKLVEKDVLLDGSLAWAFSSDNTGSKNVTLPGYALASNRNITPIITKFDGKTLKYGSPSSEGSDVISAFQWSSGSILFSISDTDTGFGETYTPVTDETKAYFNGWQAKTVDANGKPTAWRSLGDGTDAPTQTLAYVSANKAPNYTPYKLSYVLASPQIIPANVEGDIAVNGLTQVEVGSGVVVREKVTPSKHSTAAYYYINSKNTSGVPDSALKNRVNSILSIFKNGIKDTFWTKSGSPTQNGNYLAVINQPDFDPTAEYTVTYLLLDREKFTANANEVKASYESSLKSVVDILVERQSDLMTMGSVNVQAIAELYKRIKALGG